MLENDLVVGRRDDLRFAVALVVACVAYGGLASALVSGMPFYGWLLACIVGGFAGGHAYAAWAGAYPRLATRRVRATTDGVWLDDALAIPAHAILTTRVAHTERGGWQVWLVGRFGRALGSFRVADEATARAFVSALGHDVDRKRASFVCLAQGGPLRGTLRTVGAVFLGLLVALVVVMLAHVPPALAAAPPVILATLASLRSMFGRAEIGADGVLVTYGRRHRWIAFRDVREVQRLGGRVRFVFEDGHEDVVFQEHVPLARKTSAATEAAVVDPFLRRVEEAMAAYRAEAGRGAIARVLAGREGTSAAWLEHLERLRHAEPGYREGAVRDDDLWAIAEDTAAPAAARAAAAFVLRGREADADARLRVAADAVAEPRLRVALTSDDPAALLAVADDEEASSDRAARPAVLSSR